MSRLLVGGIVAVLGLPLVVAVLTLRRPTWFPVLDLAMTELRLRDVGGSHTPLIGLPGRIGTLAEQGSHPGPISFYALAPVYRLLGSSAWAMQAGVVVLDLLALSLSVWMAARRGGRALAVGMAVALALLTAGYGISTLTEPWNPYLPVLWWVVLLLAVWSVLAGDLALVLVAVVAASFCAQTHVPYLGLAGGLGALVLVSLALRWWRASPGTGERRRVLVWGAAAAGLTVVLWLPPLLDQLFRQPPNGSLLLDSLGTPEEEPIGLGQGVELALLHLDPTGYLGGGGGASGSLVDASSDPDGSVVPGLLTLVAWAGAAVWTAAHRRAQPALARLHLVVGVAFVFGIISMSRIYGKIWYYLMLWAWGTAALLLVAVGWTALAALGPRLDERRRAGWTRIGAGAAAVVVAASTIAAVAEAAGTEPPAENLSSTLGQLLPDTMAALDAGTGAAVGPDGRYVLVWNDAFYFGSQFYGLLSELERHGYDAGVEPVWRVPGTRHRVIDPPASADATIALATGLYVDQWRAVPGAVEVAFVEPRDDAERAEFDRLRAEVIGALVEQGLGELVPIVDNNLFGVSIDPLVSTDLQRKLARMLELGEPTAVFVAPPGSHL